MYYRRRRRKTSISQRKPVVDIPLNDVWESYQEKKSYKDFEISDEAFAFFSDREKCKQIIANNQYWKAKNQKLGKYLLVSFGLGFVSLLISFDLGNPVLFIIPAVLFFIWLVMTIICFVYEHKIVNSFDNYEGKYDEYMKYLEKYSKKENQYLTHVRELEDFKSNESSFLNGVVEKLKKIQGRTYRTEDDWKQMADREFEIEVGKVYSRLGYETTVTKQSGDGGVDVIVKKDGEVVYIQCKHYSKKTHLGAPELQGFWGCCSGNGVKKGIMVCTSTLTKDARSFANKLKGQLEIVGMRELLELDKSFYYSHPTNAERSFTDSFKTFILNNHFIDCYHLWLLSEVFYNEEDAKVRMAKLNKWKDYSYVAKDIIVNLTNKIRVFVILLVPDYLMKEVQETRLS